MPLDQGRIPTVLLVCRRGIFIWRRCHHYSGRWPPYIQRAQPSLAFTRTHTSHLRYLCADSHITSHAV